MAGPRQNYAIEIRHGERWLEFPTDTITGPVFRRFYSEAAAEAERYRLSAHGHLKLEDTRVVDVRRRGDA